MASKAKATAAAADNPPSPNGAKDSKTKDAAVAIDDVVDSPKKKAHEILDSDEEDVASKAKATTAAADEPPKAKAATAAAEGPPSGEDAMAPKAKPMATAADEPPSTEVPKAKA